MRLPDTESRVKKKRVAAQRVARKWRKLRAWRRGNTGFVGKGEVRGLGFRMRGTGIRREDQTKSYFARLVGKKEQPFDKLSPNGFTKINTSPFTLSLSKGRPF